MFHLNDVPFSAGADPPLPGDPGQAARPGGSSEIKPSGFSVALSQCFSSLSALLLCRAIPTSWVVRQLKQVMLAGHAKGRITVSSARSRAESCLQL